MRIPRPDNLKPPIFKGKNWVKSGPLFEGFHKGLLSLSMFSYINFDRSWHPPTWERLWKPPKIEEDENEDASWTAIRILGAGNFGKVALYRRILDGEIVDEIAIKEVRRPTNLEGDSLDEVRNQKGGLIARYEGLPREAVFNSILLQQESSEHIGFLRKFHCYADATDTHGMYRFFFNYCPFDSLSTLARKYRIWDAWLPELFLWHVLIQLLKGIQVLEKRPPKDSIIHIKRSWKDAFLIHLDLKPDNILLDYGTGEDGPSLDAHYPHVRIADFGISEYTSEHDDDNPDCLDGGTIGYRPPEQTQRTTDWGQNFQEPPLDKADKWTTAHNLWAIGKIMFDIMTHEHEEFIEEEIVRTEEAAYDELGEHYLPLHVGDLWNVLSLREGEQLANATERCDEVLRMTGQSDVAGEQNAKNIQLEVDKYDALENYWEYSENLTDLVRALLDPKPGKRPSSSEALETAIAGRKAYIRARQHRSAKQRFPTLDGEATRTDETNDETLHNIPEALRTSSKLYYRGNEINDMDAGNGEYAADQYGYLEMAKKSDPDAPRLAPPQDKWNGLIDPIEIAPPTLEIYDGSRRIENPKIRLREAGQPRSPERQLPTEDEYRALNHTRLAQEVARRSGATEIAKEAQILQQLNTPEQLITRLMHLDGVGARGRRPDEIVEAAPLSQNDTAPRSSGTKRSSDDGGDESDDAPRPMKRQDKGKGRASPSRAIASERGTKSTRSLKGKSTGPKLHDSAHRVEDDNNPEDNQDGDQDHSAEVDDPADTLPPTQAAGAVDDAVLGPRKSRRLQKKAPASPAPAPRPARGGAKKKTPAAGRGARAQQGANSNAEMPSDAPARGKRGGKAGRGRGGRAGRGGRGGKGRKA